MKSQFIYGRLRYVSFILLDILCLIVANIIAAQIYLTFNKQRFELTEYAVMVLYMVIIDIFVTIAFNTLSNVLRRNKQEEVIASTKHVASSFLLLVLFLFSIKRGAAFSRVTTYLAYTIYLSLVILCHTVWKELLRANRNKGNVSTAFLVTTTRYSEEGLDIIENAGIKVNGMFITDNGTNEVEQNISVLVDQNYATSFLCWEWIDKVYIYGPADIDLPEDLLTSCKHMSISVYVLPARKSLGFEVVKIRTALQKDDNNTGLSFFEGEHDIPFRINRIYTIFESEQDNQKGYHAHKQSWHFLFCPFGSIAVIVDTGKERKTILLSDPSTGLILHPGLWREIVWKKSGSILCVAASGHYDSDRLRNNYYEYLKFLQAREWSAMIESAEIVREA